MQLESGLRIRSARCTASGWSIRAHRDSLPGWLEADIEDNLGVFGRPSLSTVGLTLMAVTGILPGGEVETF